MHLGQRTLFGSVWPKDRAKLGQTKQRLFQRFDEGTVKAVVDQTTFDGLEGVADAVDFMLTGQALGKVVVKL